MRNEEFVVSRKELYSRIWAEPMVKVAKKFGISDVGLAKICRNNNIPIPPRGYWARKQAGYRVKATPLPPEKEDYLITISGQGPRPKAEAPPELETVKKNIQQKSISVPKALKNPHPFIERAAKLLAAQKPKADDVVPIHGSKVLDVKATPRNFTRALLLFDTIIKTLEQDGFKVSIDDSGTNVLISGIRIYFSLREGLKMIYREPDEWEQRHGYEKVRKFVSSGQLVFEIKNPYAEGVKKMWRDGRKQLEEDVAGIIAGLVDYSVAAKRHDEELKEWHRQQEEERRKEQEAQERIRAEEKKFAELLQYVQQWQQSESIRQFADAIARKVREPDSGLEVDEEWLAWVRKQADRIDPLVPKLDQSES